MPLLGIFLQINAYPSQLKPHLKMPLTMAINRIITATALHLGLPLISRDRKIQLAQVETIW